MCGAFSSSPANKSRTLSRKVFDWGCIGRIGEGGGLNADGWNCGMFSIGEGRGVELERLDNPDEVESDIGIPGEGTEFRMPGDTPGCGIPGGIPCGMPGGSCRCRSPSMEARCRKSLAEGLCCS